MYRKLFLVAAFVFLLNPSISRAAEEKVRFFAFGHVYPDYEAVSLSLEKLNNEKPDFVVFLGDTLPPHHQEEWEDVFEITEQIDVPVYFVPGNHDIEDREDDLSLFEEKAGPLFQKFSHGNIDFFTLNSSNVVPLATFDVIGEQVDWFNTEYGRSQNEKIVFVHHCLFYQDDNQLCNTRGQVLGPESSWARNIVPTIKDNVLAVFTGDVGTRHPYFSYQEDDVQYYGVGFAKDSLRYPQHYLDVAVFDDNSLSVKPILIRNEISNIESLKEKPKQKSFRESIPKLSYERFRIIAITYSKKIAFLTTAASVVLFALLVWLWLRNKK